MSWVVIPPSWFFRPLPSGRSSVARRCPEPFQTSCFVNPRGAAFGVCTHAARCIPTSTSTASCVTASCLGRLVRLQTLVLRHFRMAPPRRANPPLLATARAAVAAFLVLLSASILLLASPTAAACANFTPTPFAIKLGVLLSGDSDSKRVANAISLALSDAAAANASLPVHLGTVGDSISALPTALIDGCAQGVPSTTANAAALSLKQSLANVC